MPDFCFLSLAEAARLIRAGELQPVDLVRAHLKRIEALQPKLRAYITVTPDVAMAQAREAAESKTASSLRGVPISYKDLIDTAGIPTTGASRVYAGRVPGKDAHVVARLRQHLAVTLGKATLNEFAFSGTSEQDFVAPARNPWNLAATPGLSSSGSAAGVAAGLAMASIGTDSGGSIRMPASYCGVTGFKPTYGLVGRTGILPLSYSCDHVGVLARSAEDAALVLTAMAGYNADDPASRNRPAEDYARELAQPVRGLRFAICPRYMDAVGVDREVRAAFDEAVGVFRSLSGVVREVELPYFVYAPAADFTILRAEGFQVHFANLRDKRRDYGPSAFRQIAGGGFLSASDYYRAQQARTLISRELARAFESIDVLLTPTTPEPATPAHERPPAGDAKVARSSVAFLAPFNLTGSPALSIPSGFTQGDLPVAIQLVGRAWTEAVLLRAAHAYQSKTDWHRRRPPV